jgi:hypothetical protein
MPSLQRAFQALSLRTKSQHCPNFWTREEVGKSAQLPPLERGRSKRIWHPIRLLALLRKTKTWRCKTTSNSWVVPKEFYRHESRPKPLISKRGSRTAWWTYLFPIVSQAKYQRRGSLWERLLMSSTISQNLLLMWVVGQKRSWVSLKTHIVQQNLWIIWVVTSIHLWKMSKALPWTPTISQSFKVPPLWRGVPETIPDQ